MADQDRPMLEGSPKIRFNNPATIGEPSPPVAGPASPATGLPLPPIGGAASSGTSADSGAELAPSATGPSHKIRAFVKGVKHTDEWNRSPNADGTGATHVKTFHSKLNDDSLAYLDQTINEWLDSHPEYEVKRVTMAIGEFTGKLREPNVICQVWV